MSASTARANVTPMESVRRKLSSRLVIPAVALAVWLIALVAIGFATYIAFNLGEWSSSFWLGVLSFVVVGVPFYLLWFTHHMKNQTLGYILGAGIVIVFAVSVGLFINFATAFEWSKFLWGVLFVLLLAVVFAAIYTAIALFVSLSRRAPSNR